MKNLDKSSSAQQTQSSWYEKYQTWLVVAGIILLVLLFIRYNGNGYSWDGEGEISVFPENASSKNYRLPANMTVTKKIKDIYTVYYEYSISSADWPNGGELNFIPDCVVTTEDGNTKDDCYSQDGTKYEVEVAQAPEPPDTSSNDY